MARQKSQQTSRKVSKRGPIAARGGTLFIVGTPIGSPDDLTLRARAILGQVSIVVAESPLTTRALLNAHGITATVTGYDRGREEKIAILLDRLRAGHDIALVCDNGMPVIYDPGRLLIGAAHASGHPVSVVPGPSALTAAAALSGYSADRLLFVGHLPRSGKALDRFVRELGNEAGTTVMFAPPSSLLRLLTRVGRMLPDRMVTLAVNMTKPDERRYQGFATDLLDDARLISNDSEVTVILSGGQQKRS